MDALGQNVKRPPNAYILFSREWRSKIAALHRAEKSSEISVRLGNMWHALTSAEKQKYFDLGRLTAQEHRQRHPGYSYDPIEARRRKAARAGAHRVKGMNGRGHKATNTLGVSGEEASSCHGPVPSRVDRQEKEKKEKNVRAKQSMQYSRQFVNVVQGFGLRSGPNANS